MSTDREFFDDIISILQKHRLRFVHSPQMWQQCNLPVTLEWNSVEFSENNGDSVPSDKFGVYAFMLEPNFAGPPKSAYLLYIGKTGRHFQVRYKEYLYEEDQGFARPPISRMLERWSGHISFHYAPIEDPGLLRRTEEALLNACIPPYNRQFTGRVGRAIMAFRQDSGG